MLPVKVSIVLNLTILQLQIVILYNFHADYLRPVPGLTSPATLLRSSCHWCRDLQRVSLLITVDVLGTVRNSPKQAFSGARLKRMLHANAMSVQAHRRCSCWGFISYSFGDKRQSDEAGYLAVFCVNHPLPTCSLKVFSVCSRRLPKFSRIQIWGFNIRVKCRARDMDLVVTLLNILINHFSSMTLI